MNIEFELDGRTVETDVDPSTPLREVLRDEFDKKGVKVGCESGRCGVCTVMIDGAIAKSCLVMAGKADGTTVTTVEGLSEGGDLHDVQTSFLKHGATQCGYCTPGFVMAAVAHLENNETTNREEIKSALKGNLCRCTGYEKILDAVEDVAELRASTGTQGERPD
jgi:aerobic-type carbon monoxide dehydrogenase small subunit (CoxS/CutS family)